MTRSRRKLAGLALGTVLALSACASSGGPAAPAVGDPYRHLNRSLRGERAIVELAAGDVAFDVSRVRLSTTETSWVENRHRRYVPTEEVSRIIVVSRPGPSPAGIALLIGTGLAIVFDDPLPFVLALDFAIDSWVWGAEVPHSQGRVVYSDPTTVY